MSTGMLNPMNSSFDYERVQYFGADQLQGSFNENIFTSDYEGHNLTATLNRKKDSVVSFEYHFFDDASNNLFGLEYGKHGLAVVEFLVTACKEQTILLQKEAQCVFILMILVPPKII